MNALSSRIEDQVKNSDGDESDDSKKNDDERSELERAQDILTGKDAEKDSDSGSKDDRNELERAQDMLTGGSSSKGSNDNGKSSGSNDKEKVSNKESEKAQNNGSEDSGTSAGDPEFARNVLRGESTGRFPDTKEEVEEARQNLDPLTRQTRPEVENALESQEKILESQENIDRGREKVEQADEGQTFTINEEELSRQEAENVLNTLDQRLDDQQRVVEQNLGVLEFGSGRLATGQDIDLQNVGSSNGQNVNRISGSPSENTLQAGLDIMSAGQTYLRDPVVEAFNTVTDPTGTGRNLLDDFAPDVEGKSELLGLVDSANNPSVATGEFTRGLAVASNTASGVDNTGDVIDTALIASPSITTDEELRIQGSGAGGAATVGTQLGGLGVATVGAVGTSFREDTPGLLESAKAGPGVVGSDFRSDPGGFVAEEAGEELGEAAVAGALTGGAGFVAGAVPTPDPTFDVPSPDADTARNFGQNIRDRLTNSRKGQVAVGGVPEVGPGSSPGPASSPGPRPDFESTPESETGTSVIDQDLSNDFTGLSEPSIESGADSLAVDRSVSNALSNELVQVENTVDVRSEPRNQVLSTAVSTADTIADVRSEAFSIADVRSEPRVETIAEGRPEPDRRVESRDLDLDLDSSASTTFSDTGPTRNRRRDRRAFLGVDALSAIESQEQAGEQVSFVGGREGLRMQSGATATLAGFPTVEQLESENDSRNNGRGEFI